MTTFLQDLQSKRQESYSSSAAQAQRLLSRATEQRSDASMVIALYEHGWKGPPPAYAWATPENTDSGTFV